MSFMTENLSNQIPTVLAMLGIICIIGSCGNLLVIIVYALKHDRLTSTVFILILAISDFLSCLILIPGTMLIEYLEWKFDSTFLCKFYYFNNNTFIPFSSLLITCIAFDRYFCLCHPFKKIMTRSRAHRVIGILILICIFLGFCSTFTVRVARADDQEQLQQILKPQYSTIESNSNQIEMHNETISSIPDNQANSNLSYESDVIMKVDTFECTEIVKLNSSGLERAIYQIVQKSQTVSYIMCIISVVVLYVLIYRSVSKVFKKRLELKGVIPRKANSVKAAPDGPIKNSSTRHNNGIIQPQIKMNPLLKGSSKLSNTQTHSCLDKENSIKNLSELNEVTEDLNSRGETPTCESPRSNIQILISEDTTAPVSDISQNIIESSMKLNIQQPKNKFSLNTPNCKWYRFTKSSTTYESKYQISLDNYSQVVESEPKSCMGNDDRSRKVTKSLKDTIAFQNLKTAAMLFVVAVVYIVTFIPAMLMASNLVPLYLPIFYLYYVNNSINPIIYGFMNPNFRNDIRELLCKKFKCSKRQRLFAK